MKKVLFITMTLVSVLLISCATSTVQGPPDEHAATLTQKLVDNFDATCGDPEIFFDQITDSAKHTSGYAGKLMVGHSGQIVQVVSYGDTAPPNDDYPVCEYARTLKSKKLQDHVTELYDHGGTWKYFPEVIKEVVAAPTEVANTN